MDNRQPQNTMRYAGLATQWIVMMGIAVWIGIKINDKLGWRVPVFVILLPLISLAISLWQLMKELNKKTR